MITSRFPRLEALFGVAHLDRLDVAHLQAAIAGGLREREDLDFKQALYGRTTDPDAPKARDLAIDVAAMANSQGGIIIIGIRDDKQDVALGLMPVEIGQEVVRMKGIVADGTGPLPKVEIQVIPEPSKPGSGYFVLGVPKSARAPHAVLVNEDLRFPRRNGPANRYLSESEVADAYRNRFTDAESQVERVDAIVSAGLAGLGSSPELYLTMALVPAEPGQMPITNQTTDEFRLWLDGRSQRYLSRSGGAIYRPGIGLRRITIDDARTDDGDPHCRYAEFHQDGSGFFATDVGSRDEAKPGFVTTGSPRLLGGAYDCLIDLLDHAKEHTLAVGDALLSVGLCVAGATRPDIKLVRNTGYGDEVVTKRSVKTLRGSRRMVSLDAASASGTERMSIVRSVVIELVQQLGTAEILQLAEDGSIKLAYWSADDQLKIPNWAGREKLQTRPR